MRITHYLAHLKNVDMRNQTHILILYGDNEDNVIERNRFYRWILSTLRRVKR